MKSEPRCIVLDETTRPEEALIGGKAASIVRMKRLDLPVPPGFVLTTEVCRDYHATGGPLSEEVWTDVLEGVRVIERTTGRAFGSGPHPLLVSVRSGAPVSMPGMMDTVLNLGINDEVESALAAETGDAGYAQDTHRRFCLQFATVVLRLPLHPEYESLAPLILRRRIHEEWGKDISPDPHEQLRAAIQAVFDSWNSRRARAYRKHWGIPEDLGTAATVQAMVFGNLDDRSGTGVLFTRNPLTGENVPYGEYLPRGQGEEVVSGTRDPKSLARLAEQLPETHAQLVEAGRLLERSSKDMQDVEFTIERGRLNLLQARSAKRAPEAAVRVAVELASDGVITPEEAVARVTPNQVRALLRSRLGEEVRKQAAVVARGEAACPGVASGRVVVDVDEAERLAREGLSVVLARPTTSPEDIHGMIPAVAVITEVGGSTSHAAVVSRHLGHPCVVGCGEGRLMPLVGQEVTVNGSAGEVYSGVLPTHRVRVEEHPFLHRLEQWARAFSPLRVLGAGARVPAGTVDLDALEIDGPDSIAAAVVGAAGARGRVLETDEGIAAGVAAGLSYVAVEDPLPALLAALTAARQSKGVVRAS